MTATERLRELLDERRIEHFNYDKNMQENKPILETQWRTDSLHATYIEYPNREHTTRLIVAWHPTPEQAIAATVEPTMPEMPPCVKAEDVLAWQEEHLESDRCLKEILEMLKREWRKECERRYVEFYKSFPIVKPSDHPEPHTARDGYYIDFAESFARPPETMVGECVYDDEGNHVGWVTNAATLGSGTTGPTGTIGADVTRSDTTTGSARTHARAWNRG